MSFGLSENKQLTAYIIHDDHQNAGQQLPNIPIPVQQIHGHKKDQRFQKSGTDPAAHKLGKLRKHRFG